VFVARRAQTGDPMSIWISRKEKGKLKTISTISIPWELALLMIFALLASVIAFFKN
jgi:hypothetical protein